ncbi:MAG TPA: DEAD/DEAH box helicase, partial [Saprospiraceae bacterium]|nr:DEAD/DEAH box helicase [Saprospiraceae bacterium]
MNEFEQLGLDTALVESITQMGYTTPTPIQKLVIPHVLSNPGDVVALAQTGTGKTAAFGLPLIQQLEPGLKTVQALVLSPTRELCVQIAENMQNFLPKGRKYNVVAVYGGTNIMHQIKDIKRGAD